MLPTAYKSDLKDLHSNPATTWLNECPIRPGQYDIRKMPLMDNPVASCRNLATLKVFIFKLTLS